ncbi:MAG TPA: glutathione peroxidase [Acidimicrobiales bacterium]|jgi:glutathione peroxidase
MKNETWVAVPASDVQPGERVRMPSGEEITATRVARPFMGMDALVALIEDTPDRWFKQPLSADAEIHVRRGANGSLTDVPVRTLAARPTTLAEHDGKELLIVNLASKCGLTPQYAGLERLHQRYAERGFSVLGFPCNQFGGQEPGTAEEINEFCSTTYSVTFPVYEKADVNGANRHPVFDILTAAPDAAGHAGEVEWNFEKFIVSPLGDVVARFRPAIDPEAPEVIAAIEAALPASPTM